MISVNNLNVSYNNNPALVDVNLELQEGTSIGIIGPNGAGKSTLMKSILGLIKTDSGDISINDLKKSNFQKKIAYVPQRSEIDLTFPITVSEVVLTGTYPNLKLFQRPGKKEKKTAARALDQVGLTDFADRPISNLSGGQLQRVFIARALAQNADYYFLDEPFVGIDMVSEKIIFEIIDALRGEGKTILIVHHDLHRVRDYFDQLIMLDKNIKAYGPVDQVFTTDNIKSTYGDSMGDIVIKGVDK